MCNPHGCQREIHNTRKPHHNSGYTIVGSGPNAMMSQDKEGNNYTGYLSGFRREAPQAMTHTWQFFKIFPRAKGLSCRTHYEAIVWNGTYFSMAMQTIALLSVLNYCKGTRFLDPAEISRIRYRQLSQGCGLLQIDHLLPDCTPEGVQLQ